MRNPGKTILMDTLYSRNSHKVAANNRSTSSRVQWPERNRFMQFHEYYIKLKVLSTGLNKIVFFQNFYFPTFDSFDRLSAMLHLD